MKVHFNLHYTEGTESEFVEESSHDRGMGHLQGGRVVKGMNSELEGAIFNVPVNHVAS